MHTTPHTAFSPNRIAGCLGVIFTHPASKKAIANKNPAFQEFKMPHAISASMPIPRPMKARRLSNRKSAIVMPLQRVGCSRLCSGAGILPPRAMKSSLDLSCTGGLHRALAKQSAHFHPVAYGLARGGDDTHGGGLGVHHADGRLVRDDGGDGRRRRCPRGRRSCPGPRSRRRSWPPACQGTARRLRRRRSCPRPR